MQNGTKYVPPHLRNSQANGGSTSPVGNNNDGPPPSYGGGGGDSRRGGYNNNNDRRGGYNDRRGGGGGGSFNNNDRGGRAPYGGNDRRASGGNFEQRRPSYQPEGSFGDGGPPPTNSRWSNVETGENFGGGGGGERRQNFGGGGGGSERFSRRDEGRRNERGFHGDMRPDKRLEQQLFDKEDKQTAGINFDNYDKIPVECTGNDVPQPVEVFTEETVGEDLFRNAHLCGYTKPTPVQKYSVPIGSLGRDLMACAQTGSGKTAGFLFPIIMAMLRNGGRDPPDNARRRIYPEALILAPTRELAQQIHEEARKFTYCTGIASVVVYGGAEVREQLRLLEKGCDLLVATPGRLVDLIERGRLAMDNVRFLVLDEADRMLDMGFEPQIRRIVEQEGMPQGDDRQTMMFSATFPANIQRLASDFLRDYVFLSVGRVGSASQDVSQTVEYVEEKDKIDTLMRFLLTIEDGLILIFVETKRACDYVEDVLSNKGFPACSIHGDKSQREREDALRSFKRGVTPVMVATDVASRGLDIPNVTQVVNYDLPTNIDDFVHRAGRTGRVGNIGNCLSFVNEKNVGIIRELRDLLAENKQDVPAWLNQMCDYAGRSGGGGGGGGRRGPRNNNGFGGRDVRRERGGHRGGGGGGGNFGGGGYGGGGGGYNGGGSGYGGGGGGGYNGGGGGSFGEAIW